VRHVPHSEQLPITKPSENLTFSDKTSDFDEDLRQQEENNVDVIRHLKQVIFKLPELHLLKPGDLNNFVCDFNLSKNKPKFSVSN
jgi:hypothetical protein